MTIGYVYDPKMLLHETGIHPERATRLKTALTRLDEAGLLAQLTRLPCSPAVPRDLARVHAAEMIEAVFQAAARGDRYLSPDTVISPGSLPAALIAAGAAMAATQAVLAGDVSAAFALVRPPGHHATRTRSMGFCYFNNVAVAASWALAEGGARRVAIVDFDVHHGNGTEEIFAGNPQVLYVSTHQYPFFPGTGHWRQAGTSAGLDTTIDIPLPAETGDVGYEAVYRQLVVPALRRFAPDLLLISAGYDGHWADPLAWMLVSVAGFRRVLELLLAAADELCPGKVALVLEGGYSVDAVAACVCSACAALLGQPYADPLGPAKEPETDITALIAQMAAWYHLA